MIDAQMETLRAYLSRQMRLRRTEYVCGVVALLCGVLLLLPNDTFSNSPAYQVLRDWAPEGLWGALMLASGTVRLASLAINGARRRTTAWARLATATVGFFLFLTMSLGFLGSGVWGLWAASWPVFAFVELCNMRDTAYDAKRAHTNS